MTQTYRSSYVADLPKVYSHPISSVSNSSGKASGEPHLFGNIVWRLGEVPHDRSALVQHESSSDEQRDATSKVVTGIGDKAFEYTASTQQGGGIAIFVFKANVVIMIVMSPSQDSNAIELVARTAVGRLTS